MARGETLKIKHLRNLLIRHGNLVDWLKWGNWVNLKRCFGITKKMVERDRLKVWKKLMAADTRLLRIAADELNRRELEFVLPRKGRILRVGDKAIRFIPLENTERGGRKAP